MTLADPLLGPLAAIIDRIVRDKTARDQATLELVKLREQMPAHG
jgi:hypothetical protein